MSKLYYQTGSFASFQNLYSVDFDGVDESITCGAASNTIYQYADTFSVSAWAKYDTFGVLEGLVSYNDSVVTSANGWMLVNQSGVIRFYALQPVGNTFIVSNGAVSTGAWVHICGTVSSAKLMKLYINGVLQTNTATYTSISYGVNNNILRFGLYAAQFMDGKLAQPAIFNKELSQAEVTELHAKKMGDYRTLSFAANLAGAWRFPNGTSNYPTYTDYKAGINGTMQNAESADINTDIPT